MSHILMKTKRVLFIIIIMGIILIPILLYYLGSGFSQESIYELNWDINIPSDFKRIYQNHDKHDFQGKGKGYTLLLTDESHDIPIITLKNNSIEIQTFDGSSNDGRNYDIEKFIQTIATDLNISENNIPEFNEYYTWQKFVKHGNILIVLYFPNANKVYFVERLV